MEELVRNTDIGSREDGCEERKEGIGRLEKLCCELLSPGDIDKANSSDVIRIMGNFWEVVWRRVNNYINDEQLTIKCGNIIDSLRDLETGINEINRKIGYILGDWMVNDLDKIERLFIDLKAKLFIKL